MAWFKKRSQKEQSAEPNAENRRLDDPAHQWWQQSGAGRRAATEERGELTSNEIERRVTMRMTRLGSRKLGSSTSTSLLPSTTGEVIPDDSIPGASLPQRGSGAPGQTEAAPPGPAAPAWDESPADAFAPESRSGADAPSAPPIAQPVQQQAEEALFDMDGLYNDNPELR